MDDEDDFPDITDMDFVRAILADAKASGLTLDDVLEASVHAHCMGCWDNAVSMLGIGAIDPGKFTFVLTYKDN